MSTVESEILEIVADKVSVDKALVTRDAKMEDLEIESLDIVEIIFAIEEKYDIEVPYNANSSDDEFETIGDVITAVEAVVAAKT